MRRFLLQRDEDESGVSGIGVVAQGVEFDDGQCVLKWLTHLTSIGIYPSIAVMQRVHGHHGKSWVKWIDAEE